jgi:hypothetical protein
MILEQPCRDDSDTGQHYLAPAKGLPDGGIHSVTMHLKCWSIYLLDHRPLLWRACHGRDRL